MFSLIQSNMESVVRGDLINIEGSEFWLVQACKEQGANVVVEFVGEAPLIVSKDRVVSVRSAIRK